MRNFTKNNFAKKKSSKTIIVVIATINCAKNVVEFSALRTKDYLQLSKYTKVETINQYYIYIYTFH